MATVTKILGQAAPTTTANTNLYTVPTGYTTVVSTIHVANVTGTDATFSIFVRQNGAAAADSNAFAKTVTLAKNSLVAFTEGLTLAAGDIITVASGTGNALTFHIFGQESN